MMPNMKRYKVRIEFDTGAAERDVATSQGDDHALQMALVDMRMSAGPGLAGKITGWEVTPENEESEASK